MHGNDANCTITWMDTVDAADCMQFAAFCLGGCWNPGGGRALAVVHSTLTHHYQQSRLCFGGFMPGC